MSYYDVEHTFNEVLKVYPKAEPLEMICKVTEQRQDQLSSISNLKLNGSSLIIVVGDKKSNNSTKLFELACRIKGFDALFVGELSELDVAKALTYDNIILSSGTSTPIELVDEIINELKK